MVRSKNEEEVAKLLTAANELGLSVTFRAAGTSLSGQTNTDSRLIVAGKNWEQYSISPDASTITLQPGLVGHRVDEILKPLGRVFSPDPASKNSAMVGGIVMNNASGMSCGTHANSDRIMKSMRIVLADGTILDTGDEQSREAFRHTHADFLKGIEALRDKVLAAQRNSGYLRIYYDYVPDTAAATINRATELINRSQYAEALQQLRTVSTDRRAYNALGVALYMTGNRTEGMEYIRRAAADGNAEAQDNLRQWEAIQRAEQ